MAVADLADPAEGGAHRRDRTAPDGPVSRLSLRPLGTADLGLCARRRAGALSPHDATRGRGRLEPVGVMWLECDANLPSGEAMVRQVKQGLAFYAAETGQAPPAAWLPDSFGYSASLPTILAGFGVRSFLTTKLSWNRVNRMPADTFRWRGVDGSEVLAHFVTASSGAPEHPADPHWHTYNGNMTVAEVAGLWANYRGKDRQRRAALSLRPWRRRRRSDRAHARDRDAASPTCPGCRRCELGRSAEFFDRLIERTQGERCRRGPATSIWRVIAAPSPAKPGPSEATATVRRPHAKRSGSTRGPCSRVSLMTASRRSIGLGNVAAQPVPRHPAGQQHRPGLCRDGGRARRCAGAARPGSGTPPPLRSTGPPAGEGNAVVGSAAWPRTRGGGKWVTRSCACMLLPSASLRWRRPSRLPRPTALLLCRSWRSPKVVGGSTTG